MSPTLPVLPSEAAAVSPTDPSPSWSIRRIAVSSVAAVALATLAGAGLAHAAAGQSSGGPGPGMSLPGGVQPGQRLGPVPRPGFMPGTGPAQPPLGAGRPGAAAR